MKIINIAVFLVFSLRIYSQSIEIQPTIKATYSAQMKLGEQFNKTLNFVLVANNNSSYFSAESNYIYDFGNFNKDYKIDTRKSSVFFRERIYRQGNDLTVFANINNIKIGYKEAPDIKWVLYKDTKTILGTVCQMAATNLYGRRWIVYFAKDYNFSSAPFKLYGLPGLILEAYDTRNDYHFTATQIEKYSQKLKLPLHDYKFTSKKQYLQVKDNLEFLVGGMNSSNPQFDRSFQDLLNQKKKMLNNPIEIKPFD